MLPPTWRRQALADATSTTFDLLVLGGGITGCGVMMDAAQRGLEVLLVERGDVASGTSSRSSKLIHGGLRYLRQLRLRLTRLSCRERDRMLELDPLLVEPLRFLYPARRGDRVPGWSVDLGLWIYDRLHRLPEDHRRLDAAEAARLAPELDLSDLERALLYTDAWADDARLTLAVAASGVARGGRLLTRAEAVAARRGPGGDLRGAVVRDLESGATLEVEARAVVNATGVWVDRLRDLFGVDGARVRPSRGSHLVLPRHRLELAAAVTLPSPDDGRPVFLIPHPEGTLVGTTDLFHDGSLDDPRPDRHEVDYLLRAVRAGFPGRPVERHEIVGAFAGLRPIVDLDAEAPSAASREEALWQERGLLSVAGGKLTTWRITAERVVDAVVAGLPAERAHRASPCRTAGTSLAGIGPRDLERRLLTVHPRLAPTVASALARRLRGAAWLAPCLARGEGELAPLADGLDLTAAEVRGHLVTGGVVRLEDLLLRRARLGLWDPPAARRVLPALRPLFAEELGWDEARWEREAEAADGALAAWTPAGVTA